ncbi:hypothetical protein DFP72DRAFT_1171989 [Ephemerocybe angulata]|uniref:Uncharacterized protein n=1 Tax=Ephemerocybe angulata TaxID=980116 RepID=A0A8H6HRL8_9AGAR|nr:hypothetical protein DFP72DRAFT_1171989 [Tulosesus angulatus]
MKKNALKSAKCSLLAARNASLQRKRRLGIDLGEAGLGPERIRALVAESVENLRYTHEAGRQRGTRPNVVLTVSYATGAPRSSGTRGATSTATHILQNAENLVLGDVDIITAGGNVERHRHEHIHAHVHIQITRVGRRTRGIAQIKSTPSGNPTTEHIITLNIQPMEQTNQDAGNQFHARGIDRMISYEQTGNLSDMTDGISMLQQAVDLTPEGDANLPGRLCNLGNALLIRHRETGELTDIVDAIGMQRKAVELIPEGSANVPGLFNNLGTSLTRRFERTGELADIDDAIAMHRQAMELTPQNDASLPGRISNLGSSYTRRFERTGNISDITESIALQQKVVDLTPQGNPNLTGFLSNLGLSLMCRFEHTSELADIERAISAQKKAVKITPQEHPELPGLLNNLGASLIRRFHLTHERPVVTSAIAVQRKALSITPEGRRPTGLSQQPRPVISLSVHL